MQYSQFNINTDKKITLSKSISQLPTSSKLLFNKKNNKLGFSLIELMITIAILGVTLAIALPSLGGFLAKMRVDNEVSAIQRLLLTARNTAINTGANAQVCPLNGNNCVDTNVWSGRIGVVSSVNGLIKEKSAIESGDKLQYAADNSITFNAGGRLTATTVGTFSYCPGSYSDYSRGVTVSISGRSYPSTENSVGTDVDRSNTPINCI